jgi:hypothetical protein
MRKMFLAGIAFGALTMSAMAADMAPYYKARFRRRPLAGPDSTSAPTSVARGRISNRTALAPATRVG